MIPKTYREWRMAQQATEQAALGFIWERIDQYIEDLRRPLARHPVVRHSPDRQLPKTVRVAVLKRDNFTCKFCGQQGGWLEIDHLIPWSTGGPDATWNLRTLCHSCNQARSNYDINTDSRVVPIVSLCDDCEGKRRSIEYEDWGEWKASFHGDDESAPAWCVRCEQFTTSSIWRIDTDPLNSGAWSA